MSSIRSTVVRLTRSKTYLAVNASRYLGFRYTAPSVRPVYGSKAVKGDPRTTEASVPTS